MKFLQFVFFIIILKCFIHKHFQFQEKKSDIEANIVSLLEKISRVRNFRSFGIFFGIFV